MACAFATLGSHSAVELVVNQSNASMNLSGDRIDRNVACDFSKTIKQVA